MGQVLAAIDLGQRPQDLRLRDVVDQQYVEKAVVGLCSGRRPLREREGRKSSPRAPSSSGSPWPPPPRSSRHCRRSRTRPSHRRRRCDRKRGRDRTSAPHRPWRYGRLRLDASGSCASVRSPIRFRGGRLRARPLRGRRSRSRPRASSRLRRRPRGALPRRPRLRAPDPRADRAVRRRSPPRGALRRARPAPAEASASPSCRWRRPD